MLYNIYQEVTYMWKLQCLILSAVKVTTAMGNKLKYIYQLYGYVVVAKEKDKMTKFAFSQLFCSKCACSRTLVRRLNRMVIALTLESACIHGHLCSQQFQIKTSRSEGSSKHFCQYYLFLSATGHSRIISACCMEVGRRRDANIDFAERVRSLSGKSIGGIAATRVYAGGGSIEHHATSYQFSVLI